MAAYPATSLTTTTTTTAPAEKPVQWSTIQVPVFSNNDQWTTGLSECCQDCSSCWESLLCGPCQMGYQSGFFDKKVRHCNVTMCLLSSCLPPIAAQDLRHKTREMYGIKGNCCCDCMASWCCTPCVISQNYREISARGHWSGGVLICSPFVRYFPAVAAPMPASMGQQQEGPTTANPGYPAIGVYNQASPPINPGYQAPQLVSAAVQPQAAVVGTEETALLPATGKVL